MSYFPMFVQLEGVPCLIVGGGRTALRKAEVLLDFGAQVTLVAPEISEQLYAMDRVRCIRKEYEDSDLDGRELVVAATDHEELNRRIAQACASRGIPVNAVDQADDCSFIFPAYLKRGEVVAAFGSGGQSPVVTQYLKERARPFVTEELGGVAACLGSLRETVKRHVATEQQRKKLYQELLFLGLENGGALTEETIQAILTKYTGLPAQASPNEKGKEPGNGPNETAENE